MNESLDAASATELGEYFQVLDTSGDGLLDFDEFVSGMQKLMKQKGVSFSKELLELHFQVRCCTTAGSGCRQRAHEAVAVEGCTPYAQLHQSYGSKMRALCLATLIRSALAGYLAKSVP